MASRPSVVVITSFGDAWTPMRTQIRAHLSCTSPTPKCSGYRSTLPLSPAFHAACSKGELIKGPFKWLPFQSYYFPITKGEQIKISSLICCFPLLLIGVFVRAQQKSSPHFSCQSSGCNTGAHGCNFRLLNYSRTGLFQRTEWNKSVSKPSVK